MPKLADIANALVGSGEESMSEQATKLDSKTKEAAIKKMDEARDMLDKEGIDGTQFIISHFSGEQSFTKRKEMDLPMKGERKMLIIRKLVG